LSVSKTGARSWVFFYTFAGRQREMGFGSRNAIGLAEAREKAAAARNDVANGIDPLEKRNQDCAKPKAKTFGEMAEDYIEAHKSDWKNEKHQDQWLNSLTTHAAHIWKMPVDEVDTAAMVTVLEPIWTKIGETARRLRGRIESVLDAARVKGQRSGENPARWRGHLDHLLAKKKKKVKHFAAIPCKDIPAFMGDLRKMEGVIDCRKGGTIGSAIDCRRSRRHCGRGAIHGLVLDGRGHPVPADIGRPPIRASAFGGFHLVDDARRPQGEG